MSDTLVEALRARPAAPPAPIETLVRRGRRAKRIRTTTFTGLGAGALAVAVAAGLTFGDGPSGSHERVTPLSSAAKHTTFHLKVTFTIAQKGRRSVPETYEGAFDATARTGYLRVPGMEYRYLGNEIYLNRNGWRRDANGLTFLTRGTVDPVNLAYGAARPLEVFQKLGKVSQKQSRTYLVSFPATKSTGSPAGKIVNGTLTVGADGRAQKIVQSTVITSPHPEIADREPVYFTSTVEFSGYGSPVTVSRPAT